MCKMIPRSGLVHTKLHTALNPQSHTLPSNHVLLWGRDTMLHTQHSILSHIYFYSEFQHIYEKGGGAIFALPDVQRSA